MKKNELFKLTTQNINMGCCTGATMGNKGAVGGGGGGVGGGEGVINYCPHATT